MVRGPRKRSSTGGPQPPAKVHTYVLGVLRRDGHRYILTVDDKHLVVQVEGDVPIGQTAHFVIMRDGTASPTVKLDQAASAKAKGPAVKARSKSAPRRKKKQKKSTTRPQSQNGAEVEAQRDGAEREPASPRQCVECRTIMTVIEFPAGQSRCPTCTTKRAQARKTPKPILGGLSPWNVREGQRARDAMQRVRQVMNRGNDPHRK